jgi:hypothetical protein
MAFNNDNNNDDYNINSNNNIINKWYVDCGYVSNTSSPETHARWTSDQSVAGQPFISPTR